MRSMRVLAQASQGEFTRAMRGKDTNSRKSTNVTVLTRGVTYGGSRMD